MNTILIAVQYICMVCWIGSCSVGLYRGDNKLESAGVFLFFAFIIVGILASPTKIKKDEA